MIEPRTGRVTTIGHFLPSVGAQAPCTRHCTRCGARLRHHNHDTTCAPCSSVLHPWVAPTPRPGPALVCPECGGYKKRESKQCRKCRERDAMTMPRQTCACGRLARRGRKRCSRCDRTRPNTGSYTTNPTQTKIS